MVRETQSLVIIQIVFSTASLPCRRFEPKILSIKMHLCFWISTIILRCGPHPRPYHNSHALSTHSLKFRFIYFLGYIRCFVLYPIFFFLSRFVKLHAVFQFLLNTFAICDERNCSSSQQRIFCLSERIAAIKYLKF